METERKNGMKTINRFSRPDDVFSEVTLVLHAIGPLIFALPVHSSGDEGAFVNISADEMRYALARIKGILILANITLNYQS